jgi:hypothetical protein
MNETRITLKANEVKLPSESAIVKPTKAEMLKGKRVGKLRYSD